MGKIKQLNWVRDNDNPDFYMTATVTRDVLCDIFEAEKGVFWWGVHDKRLDPRSLLFGGETDTLERAKRACEMAIVAPANFLFSSEGASV